MEVPTYIDTLKCSWSWFISQAKTASSRLLTQWCGFNPALTHCDLVSARRLTWPWDLPPYLTQKMFQFSEPAFLSSVRAWWGPFVHMWVIFVACEWVSPGELNTHSVDSRHALIPCVKVVIVKTEVMSGCQSICNTPVHKDSSHHQQSTKDTDGVLSWRLWTLCCLL